ncbi:MAG: hypothetical protein K0S09_3207 [Sphingobacteriaceae bacterium]|jgi:4'-phosphopantetheinyl transferase|nr:hypothetical protein [Sphingobacteriaceae bacterium]
MVYICRTGKLTNSQQENLLAFLSEAERQKAFKFKDRTSAELYLQSHAFKRILLAKELQQPPQSLLFEENAFGKPFLTGLSEKTYFNLAHTPGMAALIISDQPLTGVDVERIRPQDFDLIKCTFFHQDELEEFKGINAPEERQNYFYRIWVIKETYLKALGVGLSIDPTSLKVGSEKNHFVVKQSKKKNTAPLHIHYVQLNNFALAYCNTTSGKQQITDATGYVLDCKLNQNSVAAI